MQKNKGKVYFIGAGPGDTGLLTVRGKELLQRAEVLLYDRLANPGFLLEVPDSCERIFVGKREGEHTLVQEEINSILLEKAKEGKRVVRLKGGDSFVFGRGGEEILTLEAEKIPYEVVPGVTSCIAAPETAGIPVTHRRTARSFHVITGHTAEEGITDQYAQYAALEGTLIFLMGIGNLKQIVTKLLEHGKPKDTPVSIVEQGTTIRQRRIDGTLGRILETAKAEEVKPPAVVVVGETATCRMTSDNLLLAGCKIGVTGTPHLVKQLEFSLRELGAQVFGAPYLQIVPTDTLKKKTPAWKSYDWLVFTSANGVTQFFEQIQSLGIDRRSLGHLKYAVIGEGTKKALWNYGIKADYIPKTYTVRELALGLAEEIETGERICVLRAKDGSKDLEEVFEKAGIDYEDLAIYETEVDEKILELLWEEVPILDYITFASASGVRGFFDREKMQNELLGTLVCIGNQTRKMLEQKIQKQKSLKQKDIQKAGTEIMTPQKIVVADPYTVKGIVQKILECEEGKS